MKKSTKTPITIIGAGLAGCFLALLLAKKGYKIDIYERTDKKDIMNTASNRSFNITFYGYTVEMLKKNNLWEIIEPNIIMLEGSMTQVTRTSKPILTPLDKIKMPYYSVQRAKLLQTLIKEASNHPSITFHFSTSILSINKHARAMLIKNEKTNKISEIHCQVILGADGTNSSVRSAMQHGRESSHSQEYATWSYKQIILSRTLTKKLGLVTNLAYTWSRKEAFVASFPNKDGSFAAILGLPKIKQKGFDTLTNPASIKRLIENQFPMLLPALEVITESILKNPEGNFVTIHTSPWYYKDFLAILGDAAHGFYPFFGQGTSAAFGDAIELARLIDKNGDNWQKTFQMYEMNRKKHMDTLGELSKQGFSKYRRNTRADKAIVYEHLDALLYKLLPKYFPPPLYTLVSRDPDHTADHLANHLKSRKVKTLLGGSILVSAVTLAIGVQEKLRDSS